MLSRPALFVVASTLTLAAACGDAEQNMTGVGGSQPTGGAGGSQSTSAGGSSAQSGLPCDVAAVFSACTGCHSNPPIAGAPIPLITYADLTAQSPKGGTYAERALVRMQDTMSPMPPSPDPPVDAAGIAAVQAWVDAGTPMGDCSGTGGAGGGMNPYNTPETCTSGITWMGGLEDWNGYERDGMHPGMSCVDCHLNPGKYGLDPDTLGPDLWVGGTVYPTAHEYDDCLGVNGLNQPVTVEITDADGNVVTLPVNATGNFYLRKDLSPSPVAYPLHAKVISGGKTRAMSMAAPDGNCNGCHTLKGTMNAPGRIMAP